MTTLLALDPGGRTGWSFWTYDAITPLRHVDHGMISGGLEGFVSWWSDTAGGEPDEVVSETFVLDGRTARPDVTPLKIEGALSVLFPGWIGQRNFMKNHAPDDLLKRLDLWFKGAGHDRDSARHAIALLKTRKHTPTLKWAYGREAA